MDHDLALTVEYSLGDILYIYRNFTTTINGTLWRGLAAYTIFPPPLVGFNSFQYYRTDDVGGRDLMFPGNPPPTMCSDVFNKGDCSSITEADCIWCISADQAHEICFEKANVPASGWNCEQMLVRL